MTDKYFFSDSEAGVAQAFSVTLSLRRAGYKTRLRPSVIGVTSLFVLDATPASRPNRKMRGCNVRPGS